MCRIYVQGHGWVDERESEKGMKRRSVGEGGRETGFQ